MPIGDCQHSGTYNGHPTAVAAGLAAVTAYRQPGFYNHINAIADRLYGGLQEIFNRRSITARVQGLGARFGIYFGIKHKVSSYRDAVRHQRDRMLSFVRAAIDRGVYIHDYAGAPCHHGFCAAMTLADVDQSLHRLDDAARQLA
jgi:glutamate-1-semialdehyde 2,1-aminomutase